MFVWFDCLAAVLGCLRGFSIVVMFLFAVCLWWCCLLVYLLVCYLVDLVCLFGCRLLFGYLFYCVICLTVNNVVTVYWI